MKAFEYSEKVDMKIALDDFFRPTESCGIYGRLCKL